MTLGNVILVREKEIGASLLDHEERHADQWAWFGLATPGNPLIGQATMGISYLAIDRGLGPCLNPYDWHAGWADGGYDQCVQ